MRFIVLGLLTIGLFGCSSTDHQIKSRSFKRSPGTFNLPAGWVVIKANGPSRTENILRQKAAQDDTNPSITIDVYNSFDRRFPHSQTGCAESYLDGIHDVADEFTRKEIAAVVENPRHGKIQTYRFHSEWFGDHLVAFILTESGYATIELWTKTSLDRKKHTAAFHNFIRGVNLR